MIVVVCGATASSKSSLAQEIATFLNAKILNADAYQVYSDLKIGVNKPCEEIIRKYNYQLIDFLPLDTPFSIADFQRLARRIIDAEIEKGNNLVIEGGSGLYIRALMFDYEFSDRNSNVIQNDYERMDSYSLYERLFKLDPDSALKTHQNNRKRVIRALQILDENGQTKTEIERQQRHTTIYNNVLYIALNPAREELYSKINIRVNEMWAKGLKDEVMSIIRTYNPRLQSLQAIGYKEVINGITANLSDADIIELIKKNTRNYAKRQMTFFRHQLPVVFFDDKLQAINFVREEYNRG